MPDTSSIAFGNADKYFRASSYDAFVNDDWRISPGFTLNAGVRWEYGSPITELYGRLVNLDIAPGFTAEAPVVATTRPVAHRAALSRFADSSRQARFQPRIGISLASVSGVVDGGSRRIRRLLQHLGLSDDRAADGAAVAAFEELERAEHAAIRSRWPMGSSLRPAITPNTFAVDPNFRVGYAQNWQVSVQRDLPGALVMTATYLGIKGTRGCRNFCRIRYPVGRGESVPGLPERICLPDLERQFDARGRPDSIAAPAAQRLYRERAVHLLESDRRRRAGRQRSGRLP